MARIYMETTIASFYYEVECRAPVPMSDVMTNEGSTPAAQ